MSEQKPDPNEKKDESKDIDFSKLFDEVPESSHSIRDVKHIELSREERNIIFHKGSSSNRTRDILHSEIKNVVRDSGTGVLKTTAKDINNHQPFTLYIDPGEAKAEVIADLYSDLNELYQLFGGSELKFVNNGTKVMADEGEFA